ncbi:MAG TPA: D-2-hydroxyacid dehydrogenase [Pseudonocardiaceae bacterium]|nr:D-2-hydroxyacid dehydrogenase [Pseudonocardiaceae bacterium]
MPKGPNVEIAIATPLQAELVDVIRAAQPAARVHHQPELLPPPRYPNDHAGDPDFRRSAAGEEQFTAMLASADVHFGVAGETPAALAAVVRGCPRLRWVQGTSAGAGELLRHAELTAAELRRVMITKARGVHAAQLAEWAIFGLLAVTKGLPQLIADKAARRWHHYPVRELRGGILLIVGLGGIGREVARLARGLGMRTIGVRRHVAAGERDDDVDEVHPTTELPELVVRADAVVLCLPGTPATDRLFDRALIEMLPSHAAVVNVGRGTTVDETALVEALTAGRIAGAALEVFATEPLPADSLLWTMDNVLLSPHTAALSIHENERIVEQFVGNLSRYLEGLPLHNLVDPQTFY